MFAGEKIIEHRRARIADMDAPGGRRRETHDRRDEDGGGSELMAEGMVSADF